MGKVIPVNFDRTPEHDNPTQAALYSVGEKANQLGVDLGLIDIDKKRLYMPHEVRRRGARILLGFALSAATVLGIVEATQETEAQPEESACVFEGSQTYTPQPGEGWQHAGFSIEGMADAIECQSDLTEQLSLQYGQPDYDQSYDIPQTVSVEMTSDRE